MMMEHSRPRPSGTIQIFLKHFKDPEGKYTPRSKSCQDFTDRSTGEEHQGCGGAVVRYVTYPREKGIYFDAPGPVIVQQFPPREDGAVIAVVENTNVHFGTCPMRRPAEPVAAREPFDGRAAATSDSS